MSNTLTINPGSIVFDYRLAKSIQRKTDRVLGFCCSVFAHACLLIIGGLLFIKPVEFAIDAGLSGMEVQLVAGVAEPAVVEPPPVVEDIVPVKTPEPPVVEEVIEKQEEIKPIPPPPTPPQNLGNSSFNASMGHGAETEIKPSYLSNPAPHYPFEARRQQWEGTVVLKVFVGRNGQSTNVELKTSSGHSVLDEAALKAVKKWSFRPAKMGTLAVESSIIVPVRFRLEDVER